MNRLILGVLGTLAFVNTSVLAVDSGRMYATYGDATFAALNGATVGQEITGSTIVIPVMGSTFRIGVSMQNTSSSRATVLGGGVNVNYDRATGNAGSTWTSGQHNRLEAASGWTINNASMPGAIGPGQNPGNVTLKPFGGESKRMAGYKPPALSPAGTYIAFSVNDPAGVEPSNRLFIEPGQSIAIGSIALKNTGVGFGQTYGALDGETGITLATARSAFGGLFADGMVSGPSFQRFAVTTAVPEPATMLALVAGLAAMRARRRKS